MRFKVNGIEYHVELDGAGAPLLLLHGFTGSVRAWDALRPALASRARLILVDLIGHGGSSAPPEVERYTLDWSAGDLAALLDQLDIETTDVLGYSLGGRVALHFAVQAPRRVRRLILESASPGIEDVAERERRIDSDDALAERILRDGIAAFVDYWEAQPLLALAPHVAETERLKQHALRLHNRALGLANSLRGMGAGQQAPLWSRLAELEMAVRLIVGARDSRYCGIGHRMHALLPSSELCVVEEAGHTVHVDQPRRFVELVRECIENKLTQAETRCYIGPERLF